MDDVRSPAMIRLDKQIKENVQRGLVFLRETYGDDWVDHINLENLDLRNCCSCVLGQVHPVYNEPSNDGYLDALEAYLDGYEYRAVEYGFCAPSGCVPYSSSWDRLQGEWETVIPNEKTRLERLRAAGLDDGAAK